MSPSIPDHRPGRRWRMKAHLKTLGRIARLVPAATAAAGPAAAQEFFDHAAFHSQVASPTVVVNFDDRAPRSTLAGNEFDGLTIAARRIAVVNPQDFAPGLAVGGQNVNSQPHGISASIFYNGSTLVFDNQSDDFRFTLARPSFAAGLWIGNLGNDNDDPVTPTTASFFDAQGHLLASEVFTQGHAGMVGTGANNRVFYGVVSAQPIASFTVFNGAGDFDGVILDDIEWATSPVPEPAGWVLMLVGAGALLARRRLLAGR